jgi:hypothetical protein
MNEEWKTIRGYEGFYEVSDLGRVRSLDRTDCGGYKRRGRVLKPGTKAHGHKFLILCGRDGSKRNRHIHDLVLTTFVGDRPEGMEGCHGDGDAGNNRLDNLRWDTHVRNVRDTVKHGTVARGQAHGMATLSEADARSIFDLASAGVDQKQIALGLKITPGHVLNILRGKRWAHLCPR